MGNPQYDEGVIYFSGNLAPKKYSIFKPDRIHARIGSPFPSPNRRTSSLKTSAASPDYAIIGFIDFFP
jgi:hypothetical protein